MHLTNVVDKAWFRFSIMNIDIKIRIDNYQRIIIIKDCLLYDFQNVHLRNTKNPDIHSNYDMFLSWMDILIIIHLITRVTPKSLQFTIKKIQKSFLEMKKVFWIIQKYIISSIKRKFCSIHIEKQIS